MYRLARNHPGLATNHSWEWYLDQAYETVKFMFGRQDNGRRRVGYVELGLMEGDIIVAVLDDLKREAWREKAEVVEKLMKERTDRWKQEAFPFGSEMAWDSTGQEEVYAWCKYFGYEDKALVALNSIIGYMPTLPHWGYNARLRVQQPAKIAHVGTYAPRGNFVNERDAFTIPLRRVATTSIELVSK